MSASCQAICNSAPYKAALATKGYTTSDAVMYAGKQYSHNDIAAMCEESYKSHFDEYAAKPRNKNGKMKPGVKKAFLRKVADDQGSHFQLSWLTIVMAIIVGVFLGPFALVLAVCVCIFEYMLLRDLEVDIS
jgi:hypothetical protein